MAWFRRCANHKTRPMLPTSGSYFVSTILVLQLEALRRAMSLAQMTTPTSTALQHSARCSRDHSAPINTTTSPKTPVQHRRALDFVPCRGSGVPRPHFRQCPLDTSPHSSDKVDPCRIHRFWPRRKQHHCRPPADDARGRESYGNVSKLRCTSRRISDCGRPPARHGDRHRRLFALQGRRRARHQFQPSHSCRRVTV